MAYINLTGVFGAARANLPVTIVEYSTGIPAIILSSATGGLVSTQGDTFLDSSGNLSVWVENGKSWSVSVDEGASPGPVGLLTPSQVAAGATGVVGHNSAGDSFGEGGQSLGFYRCSGASLTTSSSTNTLLWSCKIPANTAGPTSVIEIQAAFQYPPNTNSKSSAVALGTSFESATSIFNRTRNSAAHFGDNPILLLVNRGSRNAQVLANAATATFIAPAGGSNLLYSFNFAQDIYVYFSGSCVVGSDFTRLDYAAVRVSNNYG